MLIRFPFVVGKFVTEIALPGVTQSFGMPRPTISVPSAACATGTASASPPPIRLACWRASSAAVLDAIGRDYIYRARERELKT